jgi:enolase
MGRDTIENVKAREILDSRGNPTIEVDVITKSGYVGRADAPAGKSRGTFEAFELRDGGSRYNGMGVRKAVNNVNEIISKALIGLDVTDQRNIDYTLIELDGTPNKSRLGGNAIVATSIAAAKAAALSLGIPLYRYIGGTNSYILPVPMFLYICGGKLAATDLDFQELSVLPIGARNFSDALRMGTEVYHKLGELLAKKYSKYSLNTGDEGSFSPPGLKDPRDGFDIILKAIEELGYTDYFVLAIDAAANSFYDPNTHRYLYMGKKITKEDLFEEYVNLAKSYPLRSIEDPFEENDFESTAQLTKKLNIQIVGDDLFVTNKERLIKGINTGAGNALLFKVNQVGTLSEALETASVATKNGYSIIVSERSGQTEDTWLADVAVGLNAGQLKNGAPTRSERVAQFNQLIRIEEELGSRAIYAGKLHNPFI